MKHKLSQPSDDKKMIFYIFAILIILRIILSNRLPSLLFPEMPHDDGWMLDKAQHFLRGEWLGPYDHITLIKGVFSPILLAICAGFGIGFNFLNTAIYCLACVIFVKGVQPVIKNKWLQILCLAVLLFNPISFALHTGQRAYRCGIGQWQIMIIFGCILAIFLRRNNNAISLLKWAVVAGVTLGVFLLTREDGTWIYPFVLSALCVTFVMIIWEKSDRLKKLAVISIIIFIPCLIRGVVAITNYTYYGAAIVNDRTDGFYAKVAGDLNLIAPNADDDKLYRSKEYRDSYYTIYVSTMEKALTASPTLNSAAKHLRYAIHCWANNSQVAFSLKQTGQPSTDHMLWALRDGAMSAGHYNSLTESEAFFAKVHNELQASFKNGTLEKRGLLVSPLIAPLQTGDLSKSLGLMPIALIDIINYKGISCAAPASTGSKFSLKEFGLVAGGDYLSPSNMLVCSGWAFAKDNNTQLRADLYRNKELLIQNVPLLPAEDVFNHFKSVFKNAGNSRFNFEVEGSDLKSGVNLRFSDMNGNIFREIPMDVSSTNGDDGAFVYCLDKLKIYDSPEAEFYAPFVNRANYVIGLYQRFMFPLAIIAFFCYLWATISMIIEICKKIKIKTFPAWLIMSGLFLTLLVFILGMCMITTTSFNALENYMYTAPAYVLLLMFCAFSVCWGLQAILDFRKRDVL